MPGELDMTNPFRDQTDFMLACDQTVCENNSAQFTLYKNLIVEEFWEFQDALKKSDRVEQVDALIDMMVVIIGTLNSMGADAEGAWNEVMRTNMAKIDPATGKVRKRADGKVLKPEGWQPPDLSRYVK